MSLLADREIASMVELVNQLANATLLEIAAPGPLAPNGDPGTPETIWTGEAKGTFERSYQENVTGAREDPKRTDTFTVYDQIAPAVEIAGMAAGASTVVIRDETRPTPVTARWTVKGTSKETEHTLDRTTLELQGESTP